MSLISRRRRFKSRSSNLFTTKRESRLTNIEKLSHINKLFAKWHWSVSTYLSLLVKHRANYRFRMTQCSFLNFAYTTFTMNEDFESIIDARRSHFLHTRKWDWVTKNLRRELEILLVDDAFDEFHESSKTIEWDFLISFSDAKHVMKTYASRWLNLIDDVSKATSALTKKKNTIDMLLVLLFTLCHRLHSKKFSNFQIIFALYLYHEDARRRVIDLLYFLSLTLLYKSIFRHFSRLIKNTQNRIKSIKRLFTTMLIYNNLDYAKDRRDEKVDEIRTFRSITSALLFETHEFDTISLIKNI